MPAQKHGIAPTTLRSGVLRDRQKALAMTGKIDFYFSNISSFQEGTLFYVHIESAHTNKEVCSIFTDKVYCFLDKSLLLRMPLRSTL